MKKRYYKVTLDKDNYWITTERDLKQDTAAWVQDYGKIGVEIVEMTEAEFDAMPEYEG